MECCSHCYGLIDVKVNKKITNDEGILDYVDVYSCLNCGKDKRYRAIYSFPPSELSEYEEEMSEYYDELCMGNQELLVAIYNRVKEKYPDISNEKMLKYICAALYNMETKTVTLKRYQKRIRIQDRVPSM